MKLFIVIPSIDDISFLLQRAIFYLIPDLNIQVLILHLWCLKNNVNMAISIMNPENKFWLKIAKT